MHPSDFPVKGILCSLALLLALCCCVREDLDECVQYTLRVQAVDADGNELNSAGVLRRMALYLFDKNGFVRMLPSGSTSIPPFGADGNEALTLVAWGNLRADTLEGLEIAPGTSLEEARLELRQQTDGNELTVPDLFYGIKTLPGGDAGTRSMQEAGIRLMMSRLTAGMSIRTRHLSVRYPYNGEAYRLVVRGTGIGLNFLGRSAGGGARYEPPCTTDREGDIHAPSFRIFPTEEDQHIQIDIYRGDEKLYTVTRDNNFNPLYAVAGRQLNVEIDFSYAQVGVTLTVLPWEEVRQDGEI